MFPDSFVIRHSGSSPLPVDASTASTVSNMCFLQRKSAHNLQKFQRFVDCLFLIYKSIRSSRFSAVVNT